MFLRCYLNDFNYELLCDNYEEEYLNSLDEKHFKSVYDMFRKYNFYFVEDIIINYLEIFELDLNKIEETILMLKETLGERFVYIIGNDIQHMNAFLL